MPTQKTTSSPIAEAPPARRRPSAKVLHKATLKYAGCASERSPQNTQLSIIAALASAVELPSGSSSGSASGSKSQGANGTGLSNGHATAGPNGSAHVSASADTQQQTSSNSGRSSRASGSKNASSKQKVQLAKTPLSSIRASQLLYPLPSTYKRGILRAQIKHKLEEGRESKWVWHNGATHEGNQEPDDAELKAICQKYGYIWSGEEDENAVEKESQGEDEPESRPSRLYLMVSQVWPVKGSIG